MFERAEGLINHCKWQCRRMVEGGDEANHNAYKSYTERYLKWPNVCKNCNVHCVEVSACAHGESGFIENRFPGNLKRGILFFPRLLISLIHKSNPNTVARLVLERMPSRKFYQPHSLRDAVVYRHSLPVDSTPSPSLSLLFSLLCSVFISIALSHSLFHCHLANSQSAHVTSLCKGTCVLPTKNKKIQLAFLCQPFH